MTSREWQIMETLVKLTVPIEHRFGKKALPVMTASFQYQSSIIIHINPPQSTARSILPIYANIHHIWQGEKGGGETHQRHNR